MSIQKIDDIYLYTDLVGKPKEKSESVDAKTYMDSLNIEYINMNYNHPDLHEDALSPLRTWTFTRGQHELTHFPFIIYTEIHDDLSPSFYPKVLLFGLDEIKESNLVELYQLGK